MIWSVPRGLSDAPTSRAGKGETNVQDLVLGNG